MMISPQSFDEQEPSDIHNKLVKVVSESDAMYSLSTERYVMSEL